MPVVALIVVPASFAIPTPGMTFDNPGREELLLVEGVGFGRPKARPGLKGASPTLNLDGGFGVTTGRGVDVVTAGREVGGATAGRGGDLGLKFGDFMRILAIVG